MINVELCINTVSGGGGRKVSEEVRSFYSDYLLFKSVSVCVRVRVRKGSKNVENGEKSM